MRITALVENQASGALKAKHGLSLYIEMERHKLLFDVGPHDTLFDNAEALGIDLCGVDTVILSHGHVDHGGALNRFLRMNETALVYVQRKAFLPHYSKLLFLKTSIGIDDQLAHHPRVVLVDGDLKIDDELELFTVSNTEKCRSEANDTLYERDRKDDFSHEQSLIIKGNRAALIMGCGHAGVVNIMGKAAAYHPTLCVGGYHLFNPMTKKTVPDALLNDIAKELQSYPETTFYTCHCTGRAAFEHLSRKVPNMFYLSCGERIAH